MITQQTLTRAKQKKVYYHLMKQFRQKKKRKRCLHCWQLHVIPIRGACQTPLLPWNMTPIISVNKILNNASCAKYKNKTKGRNLWCFDKPLISKIYFCAGVDTRAEAKWFVNWCRGIVTYIICLYHKELWLVTWQAITVWFKIIL